MFGGILNNEANLGQSHEQPLKQNNINEGNLSLMTGVQYTAPRHTAQTGRVLYRCMSTHTHTQKTP